MGKFEKFMELKNQYKIKFRKDHWVRLVCRENNSVHVERLGETLSVLLAENMSGHSTGYKIIGIFENYEKAVDDYSPTE